MPSPPPSLAPPLPASTTPPPKRPSNSSTPPPPAPSITQAEQPTQVSSTADAARARKIAALETKIASLRRELEANRTKEEEVRGGLKTSTPELTVQNHISLLHEYNRIRDIGTGLLGIIAENRGVRVRDLWDEFGVQEGD